MSEREEGLVTGWAMRRYAGLVVVVVLVTMGLSLAVAHALRRDAGYTATALVIAKQLTVRQEQLPRLGESVFNGGSVARAVAGSASADDYRTLVPDKISMEPVPDTIAFRVQGHSTDPHEAARLANAAADAFVVQLNKAGAGVGSFSLQDPAYVPFERDVPSVGFPVAAATGLVAGGIFAVVVLASLIGLRRPLLGPEDAAEAAGAAVLAVVTLPTRGRGGARGVRHLVEILPDLPSRAVEIIGPIGSRQARRGLLAELEVVAPKVRPATGAAAQRVEVLDLMDDVTVALHLPATVSEQEDEALASVLVVVHEGASRRAVVDVVEDFPDEEVAGVVFVRRRRRLRPETAQDAAPQRIVPVSADRGLEGGARGAGAARSGPAAVRGHG